MTTNGTDNRKGISFMEAARRFGDDETAQDWFIERRWKDGVICPFCGSNRIGERKRRGNALRQWRCNDRKACGKAFTVKTKTVMHASKLSLSQWALALYLYSVNLKGVSSRQLRRELGIKQDHAWHLAHRIRKAMEAHPQVFRGPVEVDETYVGGKRRNMSNSKRAELEGRGSVGKTAVVGMKDRETNRVEAEVVESTDKQTLQGFVEVNTETDAVVYTDEHKSYDSLARPHQSVKHSVKEFVDGQAHTNGIESFWAMLKRGHMGVYHQMSAKHLHRYVSEFAGRHNVRMLDTEDQMSAIVAGAEGKRLPYAELVG